MGVGGGWAQQVGGPEIHPPVRGITSLPALLCHRRLSALRWNAEEPPLKPDPAPSPGRALSRGRSLPLCCFSWKGVQVGRRRGRGGRWWSGGGVAAGGLAEVVPYRWTGYFSVAAVRCRGRVRLRNAERIFFHTFNPLLHAAHPPLPLPLPLLPPPPAPLLYACECGVNSRQSDGPDPTLLFRSDRAKVVVFQIWTKPGQSHGGCMLVRLHKWLRRVRRRRKTLRFQL